MSTPDVKRGKAPPDDKEKRETESDLILGEGVSGTSQTHSAASTTPFSGPGSAGASQSPAMSKSKRQPTVTKTKGATGSGGSQKKTKCQKQSAPQTLKVSMPAIKGKTEKKLQKQATQDSSEYESCEESIPALEVDPQTHPLPVDPSDDEDLTGSMDRHQVTESVPTDTQRYRDDVESEDDIQITVALWPMAKFQSARILDTAARRAKISSISTPWGRERVYVQLRALCPMAKFHAQIWQF